VIIVNERPGTSVPAELLDGLSRIPPATIGHLRDFGFMDVALRPIGRGRFTVCGPAATVRCMAIDSTVVYQAIAMARRGDVLVIDRNGETKHACWGEMTSLAARVRGLAGTVVDGPATDVVEIEGMEYLVFSRGISPITTRSLALSGKINTTVQCGGMVVNPGDIILTDDNGVPVIAPEDVAGIVEQCEPRAQREQEIRQRLLDGGYLPDITGARQKIAAALTTDPRH
jgi:4-hydroxy-4-methyl-2-oxoglutarate aldolase